MTTEGVLNRGRQGEEQGSRGDLVAGLEGITTEHVATLRKASTSTASRSHYPKSDDPLGQAAYTAAALRGLAEAVAALQGAAK